MFKHRTTRKCGESEGKLIKQSANCCLPKWMSTSVKASPLQGWWAANSSYSTASAQTGGGGVSIGGIWRRVPVCVCVCVCVCLCVCVRRGGRRRELKENWQSVKKGVFYLFGRSAEMKFTFTEEKTVRERVCVLRRASHMLVCAHNEVSRTRQHLRGRCCLSTSAEV